MEQCTIFQTCVWGRSHPPPPTLTTVVDVGASGISRLLSFRDCAGHKEHEQAALPNIMR
jgi:hypothetical protein